MGRTHVSRHFFKGLFHLYFVGIKIFYFATGTWGSPMACHGMPYLKSSSGRIADHRCGQNAEGCHLVHQRKLRGKWVALRWYVYTWNLWMFSILVVEPYKTRSFHCVPYSTCLFWYFRLLAATCGYPCTYHFTDIQTWYIKYIYIYTQHPWKWHRQTLKQNRYFEYVELSFWRCDKLLGVL